MFNHILLKNGLLRYLDFYVFVQNNAMKSSDIQKRLAENLKRIRKQQKLTQFELAEKAGISDETIKKIELCKTWTSEKTLSQITDSLQVDIHTLFLPIASSFDRQISEDNRQIKENIIENLRKFIDENLKKMSDEE
mgnify:FL=1